MKLQQQKLLKQLSFELSDNEIKYGEKFLNNKQEFNLPYEAFSGKINTLEIAQNIWLILGSIFIGFALLNLVFTYNTPSQNISLVLIVLSIGLILLLIYRVTQKKLWVLPLENKGQLVLYKSYPNEDMVNHFLKTYEQKRVDYLKANYGTLDSQISYEKQVELLKWLKNVNAIDQELYNAKYRELQKLTGNFNSERPIGF